METLYFFFFTQSLHEVGTNLPMCWQQLFFFKSNILEKRFVGNTSLYQVHTACDDEALYSLENISTGNNLSVMAELNASRVNHP